MAVYTPLDYLIGLTILLIIMWIASKYVFRQIELDRFFAYSMAPIIVLTISIRVLADAGVFEKNGLWSVTPGIYVTGTIAGILVLSAGKFVEKNYSIPYWKVSAVLGIIPAGYFFLKLYREMDTPNLMFEPLFLASTLTVLIYLVSGASKSSKIFQGSANILIIFGHMLDASASYIGIDKYGFFEEHPVPEFLINLSGTALIMIPLKITVILIALYYLEKWKDEEESDLYYKMIKFVFFIFGFGPGARNTLLLAL